MASWIKRLFGRAKPSGQRMFAAARPDRLTSGWRAATTSADAESVASLSALRNRSRQLVRDNPHALRARAVVVNNVIGQGIGLQVPIRNNRGRLVRNTTNPLRQHGKNGAALKIATRAEACIFRTWSAC